MFGVKFNILWFNLEFPPKITGNVRAFNHNYDYKDAMLVVNSAPLNYGITPNFCRSKSKNNLNKKTFYKYIKSQQSLFPIKNAHLHKNNDYKNHFHAPRTDLGCVGEQCLPEKAMASGQSQFSSHPFPAHYSNHGHAHAGSGGYHHAYSHHHHLSQTSLHAQYSNTLHHLSTVAASAGRTSELVSNSQVTPTGNGTGSTSGNGSTSLGTMNHLGNTMYATKRRRRNSKK